MRGGGHPGGEGGTPGRPEDQGRAGDLRPGFNRLDVVGLGSTGPDGITLSAKAALARAEVVMGYRLYVEEARPHLPEGATILASGMTAETRRAEEAIQSAVFGRITCLVSGGDPGVYAMAGAVLEVAAARGIDLSGAPGGITLEVVTGTPSLTAAAALLGAPLTHDFCAISLSDRLTPWETIAKRLDLAARAGLVICLHNPKSRGRDWQLGAAVEILLQTLPPEIPAGLARRCGRPGQSTELTTLGRLAQAEVDMQTIIIVGSEKSFVYQGRLITPRGYLDKYGSGSAIDGDIDEDGD
jgi:precorrin-3B C17-methyltransferase